MSAVAAGLLAGAAADRVLGDPSRFHPVAGLGRLAAALEHALWRHSRVRGALYVLLVVGGVTAASVAVDARLGDRPLARAVFTAALVWAALGGRSLSRAALALGGAVRRGELERARALLPTLAGRDPEGLGPADLCRAAVESVAENTADAVVGPLLCGALAGPAGVVAYRAANTLDAMVGHRNPRYERFGWAAARLDDVLTWPAARLAALLAVALAPVVRGSARGAWDVLRRDGHQHPSPNAGLLEAAFAGALGVRLGGRNRYGGRVEERPQIGSGRPPEPQDVERAVRLAELVGAAAAAVCALVAWRLHR